MLAQVIADWHFDCLVNQMSEVKRSGRLVQHSFCLSMTTSRPIGVYDVDEVNTLVGWLDTKVGSAL